jgi:hypothetical protein
LTRYENNIAAQIEIFILRRMDELEGLLKDGESLQLDREIQGEFPLIENFSIKIKSARFPDYKLYRQAQGLYEDFITLQRDIISGELRDKAKDRIESYHRFDELERYGALLSKYPLLLDYLALENGER